MAKLLPNFALMKANYPTDPDPQKIKREIGKDVDQAHYRNTCVIRLSKALNYAGHAIPSDTAAFRTKEGADGKWYGLRVSEFRKYMVQTYGKPVLEMTARKGRPIKPSHFKGYRGILGIEGSGFTGATGHFTLWDIDRMLYGLTEAYFEMAQWAALWSPDDPKTRWSVADY